MLVPQAFHHTHTLRGRGSLVCRASSRTGRVTQGNPVVKTTTKEIRKMRMPRLGVAQERALT